MCEPALFNRWHSVPTITSARLGRGVRTGDALPANMGCVTVPHVAKPVFPSQLTTGQSTAIIWAATVALSANLFVKFQWWRPYCKHQTDGPGYYAIGLPLPFAEPTGASSLEFSWMPHVYALDTLILTAFGYLIARRFTLQRNFRNRRTATLITGLGVAALILVGVLQAFVWTTGWWPTKSIPNLGPDSYFDFRPAIFFEPIKNGRFGKLCR